MATLQGNKADRGSLAASGQTHTDRASLIELGPFAEPLRMIKTIITRPVHIQNTIEVILQVIMTLIETIAFVVSKPDVQQAFARLPASSPEPTPAIPDKQDRKADDTDSSMHGPHMIGIEGGQINACQYKAARDLVRGPYGKGSQREDHDSGKEYNISPEMYGGYYSNIKNARITANQFMGGRDVFLN